MSGSPGAYNWTGFYAGANAGGAFKRESNSLSVENDSVTNYFFAPALPGVDASGSRKLNDEGFTAGVQAGYNGQSGRFVWGVEIDFNWLDLSTKRGGTSLYTTNSAPYVLTVKESTDWLLTARPRVGWAVDSWLLYGTFGLAVSHSNFEQFFAEQPFTPAPENVSASRTKIGWVVGTGVEVALWGNWTAKGEYLFARFDGTDVVGRLGAANGASPTPGFVDGAKFTNSLSHLDLHLARIGLNYHFK
jgi:outer membrane immunogenic protein